jgi:hypothetical protein
MSDNTPGRRKEAIATKDMARHGRQIRSRPHEKIRHEISPRSTGQKHKYGTRNYST